MYCITVNGEEGICTMIPENSSTKDDPDLRKLLLVDDNSSCSCWSATKFIQSNVPL